MAVRKLKDISGTRDHTSLLSTDKLIVPLAAGDCLISLAELQLALGLQLATAVTGAGAVAAGFLTPVDMTTGSGYAVTLPSAAALSSGALPVVALYDSAALFDTKNLTISHGSVNIGGVAADLVCNLRGGILVLMSEGTNWLVFGNATGPTLRTVTDADANVVLSDCGPAGRGGTIHMNSASAHNIILPANGTIQVPIGYEVYSIQLGAGKTTWTVTTDTINGSSSKVASAGQYAITGARKTASTNWIIFGDRS
jgi:hypothetical protein